MLNRLKVALATALVIAVNSAYIGAAEESQTETKKTCCANDKDSGCKECKCKSCSNENCDKENCSCEGCKKAECPCSKSAITACSEKGCKKGCPCAGGQCKKGNLASSCSGDSCCNKTGDCASQAVAFATADVWQLITRELAGSGACDCAEFGCTAESTPSHSVYLVLDEADSDYAFSAQCKPNATVGSVLRNAILPHPIDFANAEICVQRFAQNAEGEILLKADEIVLPVSWDNSTGEPTMATNHALMANDRLLIEPRAGKAPFDELAAATVREAPGAAACNCTGNRSKQSCACDNTAEPSQIQYSIQIIEDRSDCLGEFDSLRNGSLMMFAESKTLLAAMRMLHKHELVRQLSAPRIICTAGQTAEVEIDNKDFGNADGLRIAVASEKTDEGIKVELTMHSTEDSRQFEVRSALMVEEGQTIVLNTTRPSIDGESTGNQPVVYVVLTPEIVK